MRVIKTPEGGFVVEDEPMRLDGSAAERFLDDMAAVDENGPNSAHVRFLAECSELYQKAVRSTK